MILKKLIWLIFGSLLIQIVFSINCEEIITSNTILTENLICTGNGLTLTTGNLNCNGYSIIGNKTGTAVRIIEDDYKSIENCRIENFDTAVSISYQTRWIGNGWGGGYYQSFYPEYTIIKNNTIKNNKIGIITTNSISDNIHSNIFINNSNYAISLTSSNSIIWNNSFYNSGIFYTKTGNNVYCNQGISNFYYTGADGPECDCVLLYDNLIIDSYSKICPRKYNISNIVQLKGANIDCSFSTLVGNNNLNNGFEIIASENNVVKNCIFENFNTGIYINSETKWIGNGWGGGYYQSYYPRNNIFSFNKFNNNNYGMYSQNSYNDIIVNNTFKNNSASSIFLDSFSSNLGGNIFYNNGPKYISTSGKNFCYENKSNTYLDNIIGPKCDCIIPFDNMKINSNVKLCYGNYNLSSGLTILSGILDCNGATLTGTSSENGIGVNFYGAVNSQIKNCNIENYQIGVYFSTRYEKSGYSTYKYSSYNNKIENLKISNVNYGIYMQDNSRAEEIHNSSIVSNRYNLYNDIPYFINANYNFWGYNNQTQIEVKILNKNSVEYIPFINDTNIDFELTENNIKFSQEHSKKFVYLNIKKVSYFDFTPNILIYVLRNGTVVNNITYNNINTNGKELKLELKSELINFTINENDELIFILNSDNTVLEIDKTNNIAKKNFPKIIKYSLFIDTKTKVADEEIANYLKEIFENYNYIQNQNEADIIINITTNTQVLDLIQNNLHFNKKPYEVQIESKIKNNVENSINIISIVGEDIDGVLVGVDKFLKEKDFFINNDVILELNQTNIEGIEIYDYLHTNENSIYYKTETQNFRNIIQDVLYNIKYDFNEYNILVDYGTGQNSYKLYELKPKNSENYKNFIDKDKYPIVFAGGLFSNISTWDKLAKEFADNGFKVYLIELTGNENNECESCYNYNYNFLINNVYPAYIDFILNISNSTKIKYVGHSNGARVAVDSIEKGRLSQNNIDTLVLVGIPGAFEGESLFKNLILLSNPILDSSIKNKNHLSIVDFLFLNMGKKNNDGKISSNLWGNYNNWILGYEDPQPGKNVAISKLILIGGNFSYNDDGVVILEDEKAIFENIESENKLYYIVKAHHIGMSENEKIKNYIKKNLN